MPAILYTKSGQAIHCGKRIGGGGEADIYVVQNHPELLLKLYFQNKLDGKEEKIRQMIPLCPDSLRDFAAIPLDLVYDGRKNFVGFLMDFVEGAEFHKFVSKERHEKFPNARWNFFVRAAKNLARSVDALHQTGFIIGDLNESNVLILKDATIKIIDSDSFQFQSPNGQKFPCEVAKTEYVPPELQDVSRTEWRNLNHDYFSLSVLIFQILFINRHPFTGIPLTNENLTYKIAIKEHRFAFGLDSKERGFLPPPNILNLEETSKTVEEYFRRAFLYDDSRPSAQNWIVALGNLERNLINCAENNGHFYHKSIQKCPWCRIEEESNFQVVHFEPLSFDTKFNLNESWKEICSIKLPSNKIALPDKSYYETGGWEMIKAEFNNYTKLKIILCLFIFAVHCALLFFVSKTELGWSVILTLILTWISWAIISAILDSKNIFPKLYSTQRLKLEQENKQLLEEYKRFNVEQSFNVKFRELENKRNDYLQLGSFRALRFQELEKQARERQELEYLSKFRIADAKIPQIGYSRTLTLRAFGIETAADLELDSIYSIKGFNVGYASSLMNWKETVRSGFVFNQKQAVTESDARAVEREIYRRRISLERDLKRGKVLLENTINNAKLEEKRLYKLLEENIQNLVNTENKLAPRVSSFILKFSIGSLVISLIIAIGVTINQQRITLSTNKNTNTTPTNTPKADISLVNTITSNINVPNSNFNSLNVNSKNSNYKEINSNSISGNLITANTNVAQNNNDSITAEVVNTEMPPELPSRNVSTSSNVNLTESKGDSRITPRNLAQNEISSKTDQMRINKAFDLQKLGVNVDWQDYTFADLYDMEMRVKKAADLNRLGIIADWRSQSFSEMYDWELRFKKSKDLSKLGINVDWRKHAFAEMYDWEMRIKKANDLKRYGIDVDWQKYTWVQLYEMEQKARKP